MLENELNSYWKMVVDTIRDGLMVVDRAGMIVSVNQALETITGYSRKDLVGRPCSALNCDVCEIARDAKGGHWCALFRTGSLKMRRCTLLRKDGRNIHVLKNASLLRDSDGEVIGAVETLTDVTELVQKDHQINAFQRQLHSEDGFCGMIGTSPPMQKVFNIIANAAQSDAPVIIFGESGTGKELVARAIHETGTRKRKPFLKVNCAALSESLLESELFGHVKGAYTGAYRSREGRFESARGGDIFLDEIGDLPLSTQVKLLRVLEEKVIERVGDNRPIQVDVRIISATNKELKELVDKGTFRNDLFFRINVIPIRLPPLRERVEDIPLLADAFFRRVQMKSSKPIRGISNESMSFLMVHDWPGNVRELRSAFEYAFVACHEALIQPSHLPPNIFRAKERIKKPQRFAMDSTQIKKEEIIEALRKSGGNQSAAARLLGVSRVTVWSRIKKFKIDLRRAVP
ncbi:MAG: sigma 54-interacting transcriptional regulator [Deltaproteobacteria bacterium]|nr:sigma 54-interacting transcriptional regulator [Deltaproteobacteria bacterium]